MCPLLRRAPRPRLWGARRRTLHVPSAAGALRSGYGVIGQRRAVAEHRIVIEGDVAADVAVAADDRVAHFGITADAAVRPDDRAIDDRVLLDLGLPPDNGIGADARARLDERSLIHEAGTFKGRAILDARIRGNGCARAAEPVEGRGDIAAVHDVAVHLRVLLRRPDVDPVTVVDVGDERFLPLDEGRKVAALDGPGHLAGNPVERIRLQHVD